MAETLIKEQKLLKQQEQEQGKVAAANGAPTPDEADGLLSPSEAQPPEPPLATRPPPTWIHALFEGVLTNETKCLCCETVRATGCQVGRLAAVRRRLTTWLEPSMVGIRLGHEPRRVVLGSLGRH